jgi:hypothetical protein
MEAVRIPWAALLSSFSVYIYSLQLQCFSFLLPCCARRRALLNPAGKMYYVNANAAANAYPCAVRRAAVN